MIAILFGSAEIKDYAYIKRYVKKVISHANNDVFIICCDGGLNVVKHLSIEPNLIIGDFDSVSEEILISYEDSNDLDVQIKKFKTIKDETDMELGLKYAINEGASYIFMFGGIGNRMDHSLANCGLLLQALRNNIPACLVNENNSIWLTDSKVMIKGNPGDLISLIPCGELAEGISTSGLLYPLKNETLYLQNARGVSNVMSDKECVVQVTRGLLYIIKSKD